MPQKPTKNKPTKNKLSESDRLLNDLLFAQFQDLKNLIKGLDTKLKSIQERLPRKKPMPKSAPRPGGAGLLPDPDPDHTCPAGFEWDGDKCVWVGP